MLAPRLHGSGRASGGKRLQAPEHDCAVGNRATVGRAPVPGSLLRITCAALIPGVIYARVEGTRLGAGRRPRGRNGSAATAGWCDGARTRAPAVGRRVIGIQFAGYGIVLCPPPVGATWQKGRNK